MWFFTLLWLFCCPVLIWLYFFSRNWAQVIPWTDLTVYGWNDASSLKDVPFEGLDDDPQFYGDQTPKKTKKGAWLGIFQPNWQNYKIAISPAGNIGSTSNSDRVIEPNSWLRGWSRIAKFLFKMADGRHIAKCWKRYTSSTNGPIWMKPGWSHPAVSPTYPSWCSWAYQWTDWDATRVVASNQHLCCKTVSLVLVVTASRTVNVLVHGM